MNWENYFKNWIKEGRSDRTSEVLNIISKDGAKATKLAEIKGYLRCLEDLDMEIEKIVPKARDPQG